MPLPLPVVNPKRFQMYGRWSDARRTFRIAVLSEGFLPDRMKVFRSDSERAVTALLSTRPFRRFHDRLAIARVECTSKRSARELVINENPPDVVYTDLTPFGVRFTRGRGRELTGDIWSVVTVLAEVQLMSADAAMVILDSEEQGGTASGHVVWKTRENLEEKFVHELGHAGFALDDEYGEFGKYVSRVEPVASNVTIEKDRDKVPWRRFIPTTVLVPTTVLQADNEECAEHHPLRDVHTPANAVGLFEGGGRHYCGIFRPTATCRMREKQDFCPVCQETIAGKLSGGILSTRPPFVADVAPWSHACALPPLDGSYDVVVYNWFTGDMALYPGRGLMDNGPVTVRAGSNAGGGFSSMVGFRAGGKRYAYLRQWYTSQRAIYLVDPVGVPIGNWPFTLQDSRPPALVVQPAFFHSLAFEIEGTPYLLNYDGLFGDLELETFDPATGRLTTERSTAAGSLTRWRTNLSSLSIVIVAGVPYVAAIDAPNRQLILARVSIPVSPDTELLHDDFISPADFVLPRTSHVYGFTHQGEPKLLTYSTIGGVASVFEVRQDMSGVDFVFSWMLGPGGAALLDQGLPAFGFIWAEAPLQHLDLIWFYNAALRRFIVHGLR